ncbi:MAG: hypothetical protein JRI68_14890 [Deltaproteobacteria bacterium]|nr:hypothetical protein [Deltaproteobacteria bacterium]
MQKDFHYYAIAVLARAAGFKPDAALTIAYASQYVDDATEGEPLKVGDLQFEPVRTAYAGLKAYSWSVQKKVYIPYHFLPPEPIRTPPARFKTEKADSDGAFATQLLDVALSEPDPELRPFRVGVALHTFADTWAHQGFSGRHHDENDVEAIDHHKKGKWDHLFWANAYLDFLPKIGHTQAGHYPDQPFLHWRYLNPPADPKNKVERNNADEFLEAALVIHQRLSHHLGNAAHQPVAWTGLEADIAGLLAFEDTDGDTRCEQWAAKFDRWFAPGAYRYDELAWRTEALDPDDATDTDWNHFEREDFGRLRFKMTPGFYQSPWVRFHRAALLQRHYVLERLL